MRFITIILLSALAFPIAGAQSSYLQDDWRWVHFTTLSGLPSDQVLDVIEDAQFRPWALTRSGVAWFDGYSWRRVQVPPSGGALKEPMLRRGIGDSVFVEAGGALYIGTTTGFRELIDSNVSHALPLSGDSILVQTPESLLVYYHGQRLPLAGERANIRDKYIRLWKTASGRTWLTENESVYLWADTAWVLWYRSRWPVFYVTDLAENAHREGVLAAKADIGLLEWDRNHGPHEHAKETGNRTRSMDISPDGSALLINEAAEMRIRQNGVFATVPELQHRNLTFSTLRFRSNGDLWVCSGNGLLLYMQSSRRWTVRRHPSPDTRNDINEVIRTSDGSLWLGTGNGLEVKDPHGAWREIGTIDGAKIGAVTGLGEDNSGRVWVTSGSAFTGAYCWDGWTWKHVEIADDSEGVYVHKIARDMAGRLWFLGLSGRTFPPTSLGGPGAFCLENDSFTRWGRQSGLRHGRVYSFVQSRDGALWFGTFQGLSRWHDGIWTHWLKSDGLPSDRVFCLALDSTGRVWLGNDPGGIAYVDSRDIIHRVGTADRPILDRLQNITVDPSGRVWVASIGGLSVYHDGTWATIDRSSGLPSPFVWGLLPERERIWVGTIGSGIAMLDLGEAQHPPPIITFDNPLSEEEGVLLKWHPRGYWGIPAPNEIETRFRIDNGEWSPWEVRNELAIFNPPAGDHRIAVQAKGLFGTFTPAPAERAFTVKLPLYMHPLVLIPMLVLGAVVIALGVALVLRRRRHSEEIRLSELKFRTLSEAMFEGIIIHDEGIIVEANGGAYAMFGYSEGTLTGRPIASLFRPDSIEEDGRYGFTFGGDSIERRGIRLDGSDIDVELIAREIPLRGRIAHVVAIRDISDRKRAEEEILKHQRQLRSLAAQLSMTEEQERRSMAQYLHDAIGQALAFSKIKLGEYQETRSPLVLSDIRRLIEETLAASQSLTFQLSPPVLYQLGLREALEWLCEDMQRQHRLPIAFSAAGERIAATDQLRTALFHAVRELLVNVVKHADATAVEVQFVREDGTLTITVSDNGRGFDPVAVEQTAARQRFGLFNIRERFSLLGGSVVITSAPGAGTTVAISVSTETIPTER